MALLARAARLEPRIVCFEIAVVVRFRILLQPIVSRACGAEASSLRCASVRVRVGGGTGAWRSVRSGVALRLFLERLQAVL